MKKSPRKKSYRPGRLSAEDAAALPDRLLDAALAVYSHKSYSDATMEEVAREAGASTKTLYARYPNKEALAKAVVTRIMDTSLAENTAASPPPEQAEPYAFLTTLGRVVMGRLHGEGAHMVRIVFSEGRRFPELVKLHDMVLARAASYVEPLLITWKAQGHLPWLKDAKEAAEYWISMCADRARIRVALGQDMSPAEREAHIKLAASIFLRGLGYGKVPE